MGKINIEFNGKELDIDRENLKKNEVFILPARLSDSNTDSDNYEYEIFFIDSNNEELSLAFDDPMKLTKAEDIVKKAIELNKLTKEEVKELKYALNTTLNQEYEISANFIPEFHAIEEEDRVIQDGWYLLERKLNAKKRLIAVKYRKGKEVNHRWLESQKKQSKLGQSRDIVYKNKILLEQTNFVKKNYSKIASQVDVIGIDSVEPKKKSKKPSKETPKKSSREKKSKKIEKKSQKPNKEPKEEPKKEPKKESKVKNKKETNVKEKSIAPIEGKDPLIPQSKIDIRNQKRREREEKFKKGISKKTKAMKEQRKKLKKKPKIPMIDHFNFQYLELPPQFYTIQKTLIGTESIPILKSTQIKLSKRDESSSDIEALREMAETELTDEQCELLDLLLLDDLSMKYYDIPEKFSMNENLLFFNNPEKMQEFYKKIFDTIKVLSPDPNSPIKLEQYYTFLLDSDGTSVLGIIITKSPLVEKDLLSWNKALKKGKDSNSEPIELEFVSHRDHKLSKIITDRKADFINFEIHMNQGEEFEETDQIAYILKDKFFEFQSDQFNSIDSLMDSFKMYYSLPEENYAKIIDALTKEQLNKKESDFKLNTNINNVDISINSDNIHYQIIINKENKKQIENIYYDLKEKAFQFYGKLYPEMENAIKKFSSNYPSLKEVDLAKLKESIKVGLSKITISDGNKIEDAPIQCPRCKKMFQNAHDLRLHIQKELNVGKETSNTDGDTEKEEKEEQKVYCSICKQVFNSMKEFNEHSHQYQ